MIIETLTNSISSGKIGDALTLMLKITKDRDDDTYKELLLLSARFNANERMFSQQLQDVKDIKIEWNSVLNAITAYVSVIENSDYVKELSLEDLETTNKGKKTKILFIASNPIGTSKFELEKEYIEIRKVFNKNRDAFEITELFGATLDQLLETVRLERPDILHIACPATDKMICLHNDDNTMRILDYPLFTSMFIMFQPYVKCLFINTWVSPIFLKKVSRYVNCAIGGTKMVMDDTAILFSTGFYTAINQGSNYTEAYLLGMELTKKYPKHTKRDIPYELFKAGVNHDKNDKTPDDFEVTA